MPDPSIIVAAREAAAGYLAERGYAVLDRNWESPDGGIPIVAEDHGVLVAVEVKTRTGTRYRPPLEQTVSRRGHRMRRGAMRWMADHGRRYDTLRVDVVGVIRQGSGEFTIEHIKAVA